MKRGKRHRGHECEILIEFFFLGNSEMELCESISKQTAKTNKTDF